MPKDRSSRVNSYEGRLRSRSSPYLLAHGQGSCSRRSEESSAAAAAAAAKQAAKWEEVRCPVCMDHPHNAVLLVCSSHEKGCRPFMCDTSSRHSNCLDQYRKSSKESSKDSAAAAVAAATAECSECQQKLSCPLCRGPVSDYIKDYDARKYMNAKVRACTMESCEFKGAYHELRQHARVEHPAARPMEVDPERQRDWRRMEQQRDFGDLLSMLRSGFSGGIDDDGGPGVGEGEEVVTERSHQGGRSITVVFIRLSSSSSMTNYIPGQRRTIFLFRESSPGSGTTGGGDADGSAPDGEDGDEPVPSTTEASTGSQHDGEEEGADGDPTQ